MVPDLDVRARDYESMIRRIKDVISARIMLTPEGLVEEIHVLASGSRNAKQLVRDVESALMAQGVAVDHKKISIAQLSSEPQESLGDRPRLIGVTIGLNGRIVEARVRIQQHGVPMEGVASGPSTANGKWRVLAEATLRALSQCINGQMSVYVEDCEVSRVGRRQAATVVVMEFGPDGERPLIGTCLVRQDEGEAVVRATLDAVNRRLAMIKAEPTT
jgi:hypothetical protein